MHIDIRYHPLASKGDIASYLEKEMKKLTKLSKTISSIEVDIIRTKHHKKGKAVSMRVAVHSIDKNAPLFYAESSCDEACEAVDELVSELWRQMSSFKEKRKTFDRKAIRTIKGKE